MKKLKFYEVVVLVLAVVAFSSCEKEIIRPTQIPETELLPEVIANPEVNSDSESGETDAVPISLKFTLQTNEDQMGKFVHNAMTVFDGKVWSVGGRNSTSAGLVTSEVWASDNGKHWYSVTSDQFEARYNHSLTVFDDKMWLIGGLNNFVEQLGDIWYSEDGDNWVNVTDTAPFGSYPNTNAVVFDDKLFILKLNEVWSTYDGVSWNLETDDAFPLRDNYTTVVFDDELFVIAGSSSSGSAQNEIWKSSDGQNWNQISTSSIFPPRIFHTTVVHNGKVWVLGGKNGFSSSSTDYHDIWYSSDMLNWLSYDDPIPFDDLTSHVDLDFDGAIWLFGGYSPLSGDSGKIWSMEEE